MNDPQRRGIPENPYQSLNLFLAWPIRTFLPRPYDGMCNTHFGCNMDRREIFLY